MRITRAEALQLSRQILEQAEQERIICAEHEASLFLNQEPLGEEFEKILNKERWSLYAE